MIGIDFEDIVASGYIGTLVLNQYYGNVYSAECEAAINGGIFSRQTTLRGGTARVTSALDDQCIRRQAVAAPQATSTFAFFSMCKDTLDVPISTRTISRRLVESGLHSRRPIRTLALTPQRRRARLEWCRAGATWKTEWRNVVFSDESRFCFFNDSQRIRGVASPWRKVLSGSNYGAPYHSTTRYHGLRRYCV
ncbi:transposable element Tcb1 transposase [Trichonephila clavipes]|nr:transposable element Tcb1 transposase [Trichonephila clavipes]